MENTICATTSNFLFPLLAPTAHQLFVPPVAVSVFRHSFYCPTDELSMTGGSKGFKKVVPNEWLVKDSQGSYFNTLRRCNRYRQCEVTKRIIEPAINDPDDVLPFLVYDS